MQTFNILTQSNSNIKPSNVTHTKQRSSWKSYPDHKQTHSSQQAHKQIPNYQHKYTITIVNKESQQNTNHQSKPKQTATNSTKQNQPVNTNQQ